MSDQTESSMSESEPANTKRSGGGRWLPGVSGNPSGRPKRDPEVKALALSYAPSTIRRLYELSRSDDEVVAVAAAKALLDRALGKPQAPAQAGGAHVNILMGVGAAMVSPADAAAAYRQMCGDPTIPIPAVLGGSTAPPMALEHRASEHGDEDGSD